MASYETEHNIKEEAETKTRRRPDLSSFYSAVEAVDTSHTTNDHADPTPGDLSGVYRMLADGLRQLEGRAGNPSELVQEMISVLMGEAEEPPRRVNGVSDSFMAELDRVPAKKLKKSDSCSICGIPFLEDSHPLVVRLPCHPKHIFDYECIEPWLKLHASCPMDRKLFDQKKKPPVVPKDADEEDEDPDGMYA